MIGLNLIGNKKAKMPKKEKHYERKISSPFMIHADFE